jgi:hypothetical protein
VVVLLAVGPSPAHATSAPPVNLTRAEAAFAAGVEARADAEAARPHFRAAAAGYDAVWAAGFRNPAVGRNRARAHRLAGNLPAALVALHEAVALARYDRGLQVELEDARAAVAYPITGDLVAQCRPEPARTVGARMSAAEAFLLVGGFALAAGLSAARFAMTHTPAWLGAGALAAAALAVLGGLWWQDDRACRDSHPLLVVKDDAVLRRGNAESYPPRLDPKLPRGVEARELTRRGGWVQVELAAGVAGWLPEAVVLPVPRR